MNGRTRTRIIGRAALLAALGAVAAPFWLGHAPAQGASSILDPGSAEWRLNGTGQTGQAEGRVSEVRRGDDGTTVVWLADGTRLTVLGDAQNGPEPVRQGAEIQAQYRESGGDKVVIRLRVVPDIQAP